MLDIANRYCFFADVDVQKEQNEDLSNTGYTPIEQGNQMELGVDGVLGSAVPVNEVDRFHPRHETLRLEKRSCAVGSARRSQFGMWAIVKLGCPKMGKWSIYR